MSEEEPLLKELNWFQPSDNDKYFSNPQGLLDSEDETECFDKFIVCSKYPVILKGWYAKVVTQVYFSNVFSVIHIFITPSHISSFLWGVLRMPVDVWCKKTSLYANLVTSPLIGLVCFTIHFLLNLKWVSS